MLPYKEKADRFFIPATNIPLLLMVNENLKKKNLEAWEFNLKL